MMIPKIIHYCWFGVNPLPPLAEKCIASWRKFLPDYEVRVWNEDNFDVNMIPYIAEAYRLGKYAFVSDYARFWILYKYGGLYFDTDVEVIRPMDDLIEKGDFMGCESDAQHGAMPTVAPGLGLGISAGSSLVKKLLDEYEGKHFILSDNGVVQETIVDITTRVLVQAGLKSISGIQKLEGVWIYPSEYFCPIHIVTKRLHITPNSRTIHHYMASWKEGGSSVKERIRRCMPEWVLLVFNRLKKFAKI